MGRLEGVPSTRSRIEQVPLPSSGADPGVNLPGQPLGKGGIVSGCGSKKDSKAWTGGHSMGWPCLEGSVSLSIVTSSQL